MTLQSRTRSRWTGWLAALAVTVGTGAALAQAPAEPPSTPPKIAYEKVSTTDPDVLAAVKAAIADQQKKNHTNLTLRSVVSAERQPVTGENMRLCLALDRDRSASSEHARVVLSRNPKKLWEVQIWSWGSCGR